jgi:hypothetical protein
MGALIVISLAPSGDQKGHEGLSFLPAANILLRRDNHD